MTQGGKNTFEYARFFRRCAVAIAIIRTLILYLAIIVSMRVMGKRQLGELEPAEFVVAVLISDLAAHPLQDIGTPLIYGLIPVLTLLCCEVLISFAALKSARLRTVISGKASVIIENGKLSYAQMRKNRYTVSELVEQLRKKDIADISLVKYAILETDGTLSTMLYTADSPVTARALGLTPAESECPVVVISDGRVVDASLKKLGFERKWLDRQLKSHGYKSAADVLLLSADKNGKIYCAGKKVRP
jgi:uncharacterized membrane protein YcaP (DUF421 family)